MRERRGRARRERARRAAPRARRMPNDTLERLRVSSRPTERSRGRARLREPERARRGARGASSHARAGARRGGRPRRTRWTCRSSLRPVPSPAPVTRVGHPVPTCDDRRERRADARAATETRCSPAAKVRRSRIREVVRSVARECASGRVEPRQPRARVSRDEQRLRFRQSVNPIRTAIRHSRVPTEGQQAESIQSPFFEKKKTD